jgi:hypothetical protein
VVAEASPFCLQAHSSREAKAINRSFLILSLVGACLFSPVIYHHHFGQHRSANRLKAL